MNDRLSSASVAEAGFTRRSALAALVVLLAGTLPVLAGFAKDSRELVPPTEVVPAYYFGMHIHRTVEPQPWITGGNMLTPWPTVNFGTWRLWDAYVAWPNLEPSRGNWRFKTLDRYVAMAELAGVEVLLPLGLSPAWASARPAEPSSYRPGNAAEPVSMDDWRTYVRTVAKRYKGRIRAYQVWNEVNLKGFYTGTPETMLELARIAYETIKSIDPAAVVVSPSVTGGGRNTTWLDRYLALGGGQYADVISYHFYVPTQSPEAMLPVISEVRRTMHKHGVADKPLWNTETGWRIANKTFKQRIGAAGADWRNLDDKEAAAYVARALVLGWASGVSRFYWYAWDNIDMGLIDPADRSLKPAGEAFGRVQAWMLGAVFESCSQDAGVWVCRIKQADHTAAHIVWRQADEERPWMIPSAWAARWVEDLKGETRALPSGPMTIMLGSSPALIR